MSEIIISTAEIYSRHTLVRLGFIRELNQTHLQDVNIGDAVGAIAAAVDLDVFQPLDMRLGVAVHLTMKLHVAAHHHRLIGWQACLEDRPVRGTL